MFTLDEFPFRYSRLPDPGEERPPKYFNSLPFRIRTVEDDCSDTIDNVVADWEAVTGKDVNRVTALNVSEVTRYLLPECPPNMVAPLARVGYVLGLWDDATDILDAASHEKIMLDLRVGVLSELKLGKSQCEFEINRLYIQSIRSLLEHVDTSGVRGDDFKRALEVVDSIGKAQTVPPLHFVTWEEYKKQRVVSIAGKLVTALIPTIHELHLSQEERDSVSHITELSNLIAGLSNDFYSFHKEFEEHARAGTLDVIHNGMAVLMSNYGYDEIEAEEIIKQEVLSAERKLMEEYEGWKSSPAPKSDDLCRCLVISILATGGGNYWQAITPRYHRADLTTTAEDRAQLVGRGYNENLRLPGYAPPAAKTNGHTESTTPQKSTGELINGTAPHITNDLLAPFEKAPAEQIVLAPWEYTKSLPGKKTINHLIDCLQTWFTLPEESSAIITDVTSMLFNATLMLDDIQDGSQLRRGKPAAHAIFGQAQTINSATYLYVRGSRQVNRLKHSSECRDVFLDELETLGFGQGLELHWKLHKMCPSKKEYLVMVDNKTGGFFRLVLRLLEVESESEPASDILHLLTLLGRYYQIRDDYMNLASDEYTATKGFCDDLSEGKFSFPLIHLLQNSPLTDQIRGILFHRGDNEDVSMEMKQFILSEMKNVGSLTYTLDVLTELFDAMSEALDNLEAKRGPNKKLRIFLLLLKL